MSTPATASPTTVAPTTLSKVATAPPGRDRLRREAAALRRAAHPNVARLAGFLDATDRTELRVEHAGDHTLVTTSPPDGPAAVACAASLAATVADLHSLGLVHRRLTPDHVVIALGGRAVLCGLSEAGEGDTTPDIRALGTLLELLAAGVPVPGTRRDRRAVTTLLAVADRARNGEPAPPVAELARLLGAHPVAPPPTYPPSRRSARAAVLVVSAVATIGTAVWLLNGMTSGGDGAATPWRPQIPPSAATTTPATRAIDTAAPSTTTDENREPVRFDAAGATFEVGRSGDVVVTGDWDCDGRPGAALLRAGTGEVFVFDVLPPPGEPLPGRPLTPVPDAVALEIIEQPDSCDLLVARRADGGSDVLAVASR